jgi:hypothetical protein
MRLLLLLGVLAQIVWGCAPNHSGIRADGQTSSGILAPVEVSLQVCSASSENRPDGWVVFFPVELMGEVVDAEVYRVDLIDFERILPSAPADAPARFAPVMARRPPRRGGPSERRPPPLLNPRPTPEERLESQRRTADLQAVYASQKLYHQRLQEARERYPSSNGYQEHHFIPTYLGGPKDGVTFRIPTAYHKAITQEFRKRWDYGRGPPGPERRMEILIEVYSQYPVPQLIGITP